MTGGAGNDTYYVDNAGDQVIEAASGGTDTVYATMSYTLAASQQIETLRVSGAAGLTLTGNEINNALYGGVGNDILNGGAGVDVMTGGAGNDTYYVDNAGDQVTESAGNGTDLVQSSISYSLGGKQVENLTLTGSANINGTGNSFVNKLIGNSGNNILNGGSGSDTLNGLGGNDSFVFDTALGSTNVDTITDFNVVNDTIRLENAIFTTIVGIGTLTAASSSPMPAASRPTAPTASSTRPTRASCSTTATAMPPAARCSSDFSRPALPLTNADFFII